MAKGKYQDWLTDDGLLQIEGWARHGLTQEQIAKNIGVSRSTFREWLRRYPAISTALKKGQRPLNVELENALIKKALGYTDIETVVIEERVIAGEVVPITKRTERTYPSDTGALIFALKNRLPEYYQDKPKPPEDKRAVELENVIRELKAKLLENELQNENPEISKLDELLLKIDAEAESNAKDI